MKKAVVLVSRLDEGQGGVATLFRTLRSELPESVLIRSIGAPKGKAGLLVAALYFFRDLGNLFSICRDPDISIIHLNPSLLWRSLIRDYVFLFLFKIFSKKVIIYWHGWDWGFANKLLFPVFRFFFRSLSSLASCHIVLCEAFRDHLVLLGVSRPIFCQSTAFDVALIEKWAEKKECSMNRKETLKILYLSRVEKDKGVYVALESLRLLRSAGCDAQLVVAGEGSELNNARRYAKRYIDTGYSFSGYVVGELKALLLQESDVLILPSRREGMPLAVTEAMACGLAIVCTRVGGIPDFFEDHRMGYSLDSPDPSAFCEALLRLNDDRSLLEAIETYNREFAIANFHPKVAARRLVHIYNFISCKNEQISFPSDWQDDTGGSV